EGNYGSLPSHTGAAGVLPRMLPAAQSDGRGVIRGHFRLRGQPGNVPAQQVSSGTNIPVRLSPFETNCGPAYGALGYFAPRGCKSLPRGHTPSQAGSTRSSLRANAISTSSKRWANWRGRC